MNKTEYSGIKRPFNFELSKDQKREIIKVFYIFDVDKQGSLNSYELKYAMRALGLDIKKPEISEILKEHSTETVKLQLFLRILVDKLSKTDKNQEILKVFHLFDEDNTGYISLKNLRRIARDLGEQVSDGALWTMIDEFDRDHDGLISQEEFIEVMKQTTILN